MNHCLPIPVPAARRAAGWLAGLALVAAALVVFDGCRKPRSTAPSGAQGVPIADDETWRTELFDVAVTNLNRLEQFDTSEMLQQIVNRFDQWAQRQTPPAEWKADPAVVSLSQDLAKAAQQAKALAATLARFKRPEQIQDLPQELQTVANEVKQLAERFRSLMLQTGLAEFNDLVTQAEYLAKQVEGTIRSSPAAPGDLATRVRELVAKVNPELLETVGSRLDQFSRRLDLARLEFSARDGIAFQEAVWLRDVSRWASGQQRDDPLEQAGKLFDWTIRNIQVDRDEPTPEGSRKFLQAPWETLLLGHGSAMDRAWVFILLARQQRIDAGVVALIDPDDPTKQRIRPWAVGVRIERELYLFDPVLGLPIPGPDGIRLADGRLDVKPATLSQVAADDKLLRQLDADKKPYALESKRVQEVVVLLEESPDCLSARMKLVESRLAGDEAIVLTASAADQASKFRQCPRVFDALAWRVPYQVLFQETFYGSERARWQLLQMAAFQVGANRVPTLRKGRIYHLKGIFTGDPSAISYYQMARLSERQLDSAQLDQELDTFIRLGKIHASYWLGLMGFEQMHFDTAVDYLKTRTLEAYPRGPWTHGANYNLARTYEATGKHAEAIKLYREDAGSPVYLGNLIRAKWLESLTSAQAAAKSATPTAAE